MFHATICAIEGEKVTLAEAKSIIEGLLEKLQQRRVNDFATRKEKSSLKVLIEDGLITETNYGNYKNEFYNTCIEYIQEWSITLTFERLSWILLKNPEASLSWKSVQLLKRSTQTQKSMKLNCLMR
jgi:O-phosphoseryl-tRNA(Cys) synthetase